MKKIVIALGGNALVKTGQRGTYNEMLQNLKAPIKQIARLSKKYSVVITHGNGPQVGNILLQQEATGLVPKMPLQLLVAETQGQIGYMIESTLDQELMNLGISEKKLFLTVLTYVKVNKNDPAFKNPTKPIGPYFKNKIKNWRMIKTPRGWRRVVASPRPITIYQKREIRKLVDSGFIVIACGGGGIPVVKEGKNLHGVEAVIDKDLASAKLAQEIKADILLIATDVENVFINFGKKNQMALKKLTMSKAKQYIDEGQFAQGSMLPKIQAAINFSKFRGKRAMICSINKIIPALEGRAGTQIVRG
ncbi:TPA: carbamate kinase [archaeon]|uniref:Carbamate kinase n=1 Tax=Candidatus Naiadarchaeum limnaeum TaxID=2756139 RepID=A0A832V1L9_9ARCH|nr:carbamate kinase [Candidatus Naiadarchaeum limnaeum]